MCTNSSLLSPTHGSGGRDHHHHAGLRRVDMNDGMVTGLVIGLFFGSCFGALLIALVAIGAGRRPHSVRVNERLGGGSSMRVDLLRGRDDIHPFEQISDRELDQEMRQLVLRYGRAGET